MWVDSYRTAKLEFTNPRHQMMHNVYCIKAPGLLTAVSSMTLVHAHSRRV